jgi:predicted nucleic acid-binding protein
VKTPVRVRAWIAQPPAWCEIRPDLPPDPELDFLDPGERAAITLAISIHADRLLIDEQDGRAAAEQRHLRITGTLGVLADAHIARLLDFETALAKLRATTFYASAAVVNRVRERLSTGAQES